MTNIEGGHIESWMKNGTAGVERIAKGKGRRRKFILNAFSILNGTDLKAKKI